MTAYLIFDPQNSLIFLYCDQKFEHFLLQSNCHEAELTGDHEVIRNLVTLSLTPYVSAHRHLSSATPLFDGIPHTYIAHQNWQEFVFIYLHKYEPTDDQFDDKSHIYLQRKVSLFCQLVLFLYGNALHSIDKHEHILKILLKMMAKWEDANDEVPFMIESIERLFLGFHLESVCKQTILRVEQFMKLQMYQTNKETATCYLVLYKDRLLYKQESATAHLRQEDMISILLLSLSVQLFPPSCGDLSSEGSNFDDSITGEKVTSCFQHLVFLKSSHNFQIPVPHIYRKVMISEELYFVSLTEVSSILMISLPTLIQTVTELKQDLSLHELSSKNAIESLTSCVRNVHKYIKRNVASVLPKHTFNLNPLEQLNELIKKVTNSSTDLIREQADRILTLVLGGLHNCYEEIAFKNLYLDELPLYMQNFEAIASEISELLQETFNICLDYIQVKYETNSLALASVCDNYLDLESLIFVDREKGYFVIGDLDSQKDRSNDLFTNMILHGYQEYPTDHSPLVTWFEDDYHFVYFCQDKPTQSISASSSPCNIANIIENIEMNESHDHLISNTEVVYEMFCIFKASPLNEQISQNNILDIAKLIKLYING